MRKIFISSDHAGYTLKEKIINHFRKKELNFNDLGPYSKKRTDYPQFAHKLANKVKNLPLKNIKRDIITLSKF